MFLIHYPVATLQEREISPIGFHGWRAEAELEPVPESATTPEWTYKVWRSISNLLLPLVPPRRIKLSVTSQLADDCSTLSDARFNALRPRISSAQAFLIQEADGTRGNANTPANITDIDFYAVCVCVCVLMVGALADNLCGRRQFQVFK